MNLHQTIQLDEALVRNSAIDENMTLELKS